MLEESSSLSELIPAVLGIALVGSIALRMALNVQKRKDAFCERNGLGPHDALPDGFPTATLDRFGSWNVGEVLVGYRGSDMLVTFQCERDTIRQQSPTLFTVVAVRLSHPGPLSDPPRNTFYRESGSWRVAVALWPIILTSRNLPHEKIEALWTHLTRPPAF